MNANGWVGVGGGSMLTAHKLHLWSLENGNCYYGKSSPFYNVYRGDMQKSRSLEGRANHGVQTSPIVTTAYEFYIGIWEAMRAWSSNEPICDFDVATVH